MTAYLPTSLSMLVACVGGLVMLVASGFAVTRLPARAWGRGLAWMLTVIAVLSTERLTADQPAGFRMVVLILALLYGMKVVVTVESYESGQPRFSPGIWSAFVTLWFGMRPNLFARVPSSALPNAFQMIRAGVLRALLGATLVMAARATWVLGEEVIRGDARRLAATFLLLPGLSLMLHFGFFNILAGSWRLVGARCQPLFRAPAYSRSLAEFWGKRWNLAFSEMTALAVYRPIRRSLGAGPATAVAFLFSGLLHELAISVPVHDGYGLPLAYFAIHGVGMTIESKFANRLGLSDSWRGRVWTGLWILLPLPLLFHIPFLRGCVWPLIGIS
jgi:alginate O-acetyltransferase complex protein AlgI